MTKLDLFSIRTSAKQTYRLLNQNKKDKLNLNFVASKPNEIWVSDTTYLRVKDTTYYMCAILDLYSRKVIAHKISNKHSTNLVSNTFKAAYRDRKPTTLLFHSDRGSQYVSRSFMLLLKSHQIEQSFSPSGTPTHNSVMEAFFSTLKQEEYYRHHYRSVQEFKTSIDQFVRWYNADRPHLANKYATPCQKEEHYFQKLDISV